MPSRPHTQRQAAIQDREREALTATGVRGARPIALRVRVATLRAFRSGNSTDAAIREGLAALVPQLKYGMTTAHLQGRLRSIRSYQAATRDGLRLSDPFRSAVDFLTKRMKLTPDQLVDVADGYGANIDSVIQTLGGDLSEKVNAAIADTVRSGDHVAGGMEKIRAAFDASGMGPRADWQIENIYRTQVQTAYAAGKWQANQDPAIQEILWGYEYVTVGDDRVRPTHAAMDGTKAPKDDPIWQTWTPPCGWNCRCSIIEVFHGDEQATRDVPGGMVEIDGVAVQPGPDAGFEWNAGEVYRDVLGAVGVGG